MWTAHIESYEEGETKFSQKRKEAAIHLQQVRPQLHEIHVRTMSAEGAVPSGELQEGQTALDATMTISDMDIVEEQPQFSQLKTELQGAVQKVRETIGEKLAKRRRISEEKPGDDVQIVETPDAHQRESTKP
jgi:hypothetical protein